MTNSRLINALFFVFLFTTVPMGADVAFARYFRTHESWIQYESVELAKLNIGERPRFHSKGYINGPATIHWEDSIYCGSTAHLGKGSPTYNSVWSQTYSEDKIMNGEWVFADVIDATETPIGTRCCLYVSYTAYGSVLYDNENKKNRFKADCFTIK